MYPDQGEKAVKFFQDNITSKNKKAIVAKLQAMGDTWPKGEPIDVSENIFHRKAVDVYSVEGMVIHSKY